MEQLNTLGGQRINLEASGPDTFAALRRDVTHFSIGKLSASYLRCRNGSEICLGISGHDVAPFFEVFTLSLNFATSDKADSAIRVWQPWPFDSWKTAILTREEFIVTADPNADTIGVPRYVQDAVVLGHVPNDAIDSRVVEVGLLFIGSGGKRLIIAADWMPFNIAISQDDGWIEEFLQSCEITPMLD
jgi:hypothetical protein